LRHFEQGIADPVMIADAHFSVRQSLDCKILSELAIGKVVSTELVFPITIRLDLVDKDSPVLAAMPRQISLAVAIDVEPSCHPSALDRRLPDGGVNDFALPLDVARQTHIDREQMRHRFHLHVTRGRSVTAFQPVSITQHSIERQLESPMLRSARFIVSKG
jgi:hypothetical protein